MKFLSFIYLLTLLSLGMAFAPHAQAQTAGKKNGVDTVAINKRLQEEYAKRDSILAAMRQKRIDDSIARVMAKIKLQQFRDSMIAARNAKRTADSIARVQAKAKLLQEKKTKDSLTFFLRQKNQDSLAMVKAQTDSIRASQKKTLDSLTQARKQTQDSLALARKEANENLKAARLQQQKAREALAKYKNSKAYKDSVENYKNALKESIALARKNKNDSLKNERIKVNDSIKLARQIYNDSIKVARQNYNDSVKTAQTTLNEKIKAERQKINDSMMTARQNRMDSLNAARKKKTETAKEADEKKKKQDIALSLKIHEKKKQEWTNEKLLKRKWSLPRRIYQNTVTRYNYYYNARRKYNEAIKKLSKNNKDDFNQTISIREFDVEKGGASVAGDMDSVIKKSSFSTQIHDPRSKWFDNLYFLMGKASFVKNDFEGAISTFQFIANEYKDQGKKSDKKKAKADTDAPLSIATPDNRKGLKKLSHHPIRNEALIWLAKSYIKAEQYGDAMSLLNLLAEDKNFPKRNKAELFTTKAELEIQEHNTEDAIASITQALKQKMPEKQKSRLEYILGQLYAENKDYAKSTEHFKKSINGKTSQDMDFYTKLNIALNAAKGGGDKAYAKSQLEKIISDQKYIKYKSQALNALAALEAEENPVAAIDLLKKSINHPENKDNLTKAKAYASLGDIYYNLTDYEQSKTAYDSAAFYGNTPPLDNINQIITRKNVLTDIVKDLKTIRTQDSMLALAKKSEKDQKAAAKKELEKLKKAKASAPDNQTKVTQLKPNNVVKSNWYFYNKDLIDKGSSDFKKKWGNRKLEDNWRRKSATSMNVGGSVAEEENPEEEEQAGGETIQSLLAKLPKTPAQVDKANALIMDAYYDLGLQYYSQLEDYQHSIGAFDTLVTRFPNTDYKKQSYYGLYLDYTKLEQMAMAEKYKKLLNQEFSESDLSKMANNVAYREEIKIKERSVAEHYDNTYLLYKEGKYTEAIDRVNFARKEYKGNPIQAKYALVEAVSQAGLNDINACKIVLESVIQSYPNTEEQSRAQEILNYINSPKGKSKDSLGNFVNVNKGQNSEQDSLEASEAFKELQKAEGKGVYHYEPASEHFVMLFMKNVDGRTMGMKSAISDYNLLKYNVEEYTTNLNMLTTQQAVITILKFSNHIFARKYASSFEKEKLLFSQLKQNEYNVCIISAANFSELLKTRDILGYLNFYTKNYK